METLVLHGGTLFRIARRSLENAMVHAGVLGDPNRWLKSLDKALLQGRPWKILTREKPLGKRSSIKFISPKVKHWLSMHAIPQGNGKALRVTITASWQKPGQVQTHMVTLDDIDDNWRRSIVLPMAASFRDALKAGV